jgi:tyrosyl-tRNA synthetase
MWNWYELLSDKSLEKIEELKIDVKEGKLHPKKVKEDLAIEIVDRFHGNGAGLKAKEEFDRVHKQNDIPSDIKEFKFDDKIGLIDALFETKLANTKSEARRHIKGGAVKINGEKVDKFDIMLESGEYILQIGKRKFAKVII